MMYRTILLRTSGSLVHVRRLAGAVRPASYYIGAVLHHLAACCIVSCCAVFFVCGRNVLCHSMAGALTRSGRDRA